MTFSVAHVSTTVPSVALFCFSPHSSQHSSSAVAEAVDKVGRDSRFLQRWVDIAIVCNWARGHTPCQECGAAQAIHHVLVTLLSQRCSPLVYARFDTLSPLYILLLLLIRYSLNIIHWADICLDVNVFSNVWIESCVIHDRYWVQICHMTVECCHVTVELCWLFVHVHLAVTSAIILCFRATTDSGVCTTCMMISLLQQSLHDS